MEFYQLLLANLQIGDVIYTTNHGTPYIFTGWTQDYSLKYTINQSFKYIPCQTIIGCKQANIQGIFNTNWFSNNYPLEYQTRPCNFKVVQQLIADYPI